MTLFYSYDQGYLVFKEFCETQCDEPVPQLAFYEDVSNQVLYLTSIYLFTCIFSKLSTGS